MHEFGKCEEEHGGHHLVVIARTIEGDSLSTKLAIIAFSIALDAGG